MRKHLGIGSALLLSAVFNSGAQLELRNARLAGRLQAEDGTPVAGVKVAYSRVVKFVAVDRGGVSRIEEAPGEIRISGSVLSGPDGAFEVGDLPAGDYQLCARGLDGLLDPCLWTAGLIDLPDVRAAERRDAGVITLKRGAVLNVRVNDPLKILPGTETAISDGGLIVGVQLEDGTFHRFDTAGEDRQGRDMQMTVPYEMPLRLWVFSRIAEVIDGEGNTIDENGSSLPFRIPAAAAKQQMILTVIARR